jgi:hypothetical protein
MGEGRELHVRHHGVDAVDGLPIGFVRRVMAFQRLADSVKSFGSLAGIRHRQLGGASASSP